MITLWDENISIHALVKRATFRNIRRTWADLNFNPRPREEGDFFGGIRYLKSDYFNPRPREEGDLLKIGAKSNKIVISIHALVKRATEYILRLKHSLIISIHALVKRATPKTFSRIIPTAISIHALVKRATL